MRAAHRAILVLGAGYLGAHVAAGAAAAGHAVTATTRHAGRAAALAARGVRVVPLDLGAAASLTGLDTLRDAVELDVYCLLTPSAFERHGVPDPLAALITTLSRLPLRRAVLASSTGVYGDAAGKIVTAETVAMPRDPRATRLFVIERVWLAAPFPTRVVRLAGLYGPGRVIGMARLGRGAALAGDPQGWLNLIHRSDAAAILARCLENEGAHAVELGSDGTPVRRAAYYGHLAAHCGFAPPRFAPDAGRGGSRRCDPASSWARLGWKPAYPDYRAGIAMSLGRAARPETGMQQDAGGG